MDRKENMSVFEDIRNLCKLNSAMTDNLVAMTIEIEQDIYEKALKVCEHLGITIEILVQSFIQFFVTPENLPLVEAFIKYQNTSAEKETYEEVSQKVFEKVFAIIMQKRKVL